MKRIIKPEYNEYKTFNNKNIEIIEVPAGSQKIHPITLNWIDNSKFSVPICLTKPSFDKEGITLYKEYKCTTQTNKYNSFLYTPPIGITSLDLVKIYNVESIEKLQLFIDENINKINILTLNKIVSSWIRVNFDIIKTYNNFLEKIYKKMLEKYYSYENYVSLSSKVNLDKEIKDFIDYWFAKNNNIEFKIDILVELQDYLEKISK